MNLKDLNKISIQDLKNIDWWEAKDRLQSRVDVIINIIVVLMTLIVLVSVYHKYAHRTKSMKGKVTELREKTEALERSEITQKQYNDFLKSVPKVISGDRLIETLSEFAVKRDLQILSFSPAQEKGNNFINLTNVEIHVASEHYANIILFMRDIENSPYAIRIRKWSGASVTPGDTSRRRSRRSMQETLDETIRKEHIEATIEIESVEFKNV